MTATQRLQQLSFFVFFFYFVLRVDCFAVVADERAAMSCPSCARQSSKVTKGQADGANQRTE